MTDSTVIAPAATAAPKVLTVANDMVSRRIFANPADAAAYLNSLATTLSDFAETPFAGAGLDSEGDFDPAVYTSSTQVMVAKLMKAKAGVKAIVVAPIPTLEALFADESGKAWAEKILQKEFNHVAVRTLREAEDISTVVDQIPTTLDAYVSSTRDGGTGIMVTFDELYKAINATLASKVPVWAKAKLPKNELKKAMESKGYADEYYPQLENRGETKPSLLVMALNLGITAAKQKGLDPTIFQRWLDSRDKKAFVAGAEDDDFDAEDLADALLAEPTESETEATPAPVDETIATA